MAKRGNLKPMDEFEEDIRANAVKYNVVLFTPGSSSRLYYSSDTIEEAREFGLGAFEDLPRTRAAMIYAVDKSDRFALVGTVNRSRIWKPVTVERY